MVSLGTDDTDVWGVTGLAVIDITFDALSVEWFVAIFTFRAFSWEFAFVTVVVTNWFAIAVFDLETWFTESTTVILVFAFKTEVVVVTDDWSTLLGDWVDLITILAFSTSTSNEVADLAFFVTFL